MEDETRPLPAGWIRQFDSKTGHQYFVDTRADPPRSIWHHPYDDEQYLSSLTPAERKNLDRLHKSVSLDDIGADSSDDEGHHASLKGSVATAGAAHDPNAPYGVHKFSRKMKDKLTGSTHEERERQRQQRAREEQQVYETHQRYRQAFQRACVTGQPQLLGRDRNGKDVYIEPPTGPRAPPGAYGYNPYAQGPYTDPNARFIRPEEPYYRPYGYGYGGGYGFPMMGGLLGGMMLGGLMF